MKCRRHFFILELCLDFLGQMVLFKSIKFIIIVLIMKFFGIVSNRVSLLGFAVVIGIAVIQQ